MCQVEHTLNERPPSSFSNDPNDLEASTHHQFLLGRSNISVPYIPKPTDIPIWEKPLELYKRTQTWFGNNGPVEYAFKVESD